MDYIKKNTNFKHLFEYIYDTGIPYIVFIDFHLLPRIQMQPIKISKNFLDSSISQFIFHVSSLNTTSGITDMNYRYNLSKTPVSQNQNKPSNLRRATVIARQSNQSFVTKICTYHRCWRVYFRSRFKSFVPRINLARSYSTALSLLAGQPCVKLTRELCVICHSSLLAAPSRDFAVIPMAAPTVNDPACMSHRVKLTLRLRHPCCAINLRRNDNFKNAATVTMRVRR